MMRASPAGGDDGAAGRYQGPLAGGASGTGRASNTFLAMLNDISWVLQSDGSPKGGVLLADRIVVGSVWELAIDREGTRLLQDLLRHAEGDGASALAHELRDKVNEAWSGSQARYASHVVEACVQHLPSTSSGFVVEELLGGDAAEAAAQRVVQAACSRYGCRIVQRLIEHPPKPQFEQLRNHLLSDHVLACMLSPHHPTLCSEKKDKAENFGHFVLQRLLENPPDQASTEIIQSFLLNVVSEEHLLMHVNSKQLSWVWEKAMQHETANQQLLVERILALSQKRPDIKKQKYSSFVFKEAQRFVRKPASATTAETSADIGPTGTITVERLVEPCASGRPPQQRTSPPGPRQRPGHQGQRQQSHQGGVGHQLNVHQCHGSMPGPVELAGGGIKATSVSSPSPFPQALGGPMLACVFLPTSPQLAHAAPRLLHAVAPENMFFHASHGILGPVMAHRMP